MLISKLNKIVSSSSIALAAVPFYALYLSYSFETGYLRYFSVSSEFISLRIETTIILISCIFSIFFFIHEYFMQFYSSTKKIDAEIQPLAVFFWTLGCILLAKPILGATGAVALPFLIVLSCFFIYRIKDVQNDVSNLNILWSIWILFLVLLFGVLPIYAGQMGYYAAERKRIFSILNMDSYKYALARVYNNKAILVQIDKNNRLNKNYLVEDLSNLKGIFTELKVRK